MSADAPARAAGRAREEAIHLSLSITPSKLSSEPRTESSSDPSSRLSPGQILWIVAAVVVLGVGGFISVFPPVPVVWGAFPLAVVIPVFTVMNVVCDTQALRWIPPAIPALVGPALLFAWCPHLLSGEARMPRRTLIGLPVLSVLVALYFVEGWNYGLRYQGREFVIALACANALAIAVCSRLVIDAWRRSSFAATLIAHASIALWLVWLAFPWLGEMP